MKPMLLAFAALIVISVGADYALDYVGFSTTDQTASDSVRLN